MVGGFHNYKISVIGGVEGHFLFFESEGELIPPYAYIFDYPYAGTS